MIALAIIAFALVALVLVAISTYLIVNAYQHDKNSEKWAKFLDDAGVKHD